MSKYHDIRSTKLERLQNTTIIARENNRNRLSVKEALYILHSSPEINKQDENFQRTLKLNPARKIDLTEIWKPSQKTNSSQSSHISSSQTLSNPVQTSTTQSSQGTTESLIASSFQPSPQTNLIAQTGIITPSRTNYENQTTHQVSPSIQHRITQFLTNSRRSTYTETQLENSQSRRRNLRPRINSINYHE